MRTTPLQNWIALYSLDIRENPRAYKASVVDNPEQAARDVVEGQDDDFIRHMIRSLRAERRSIAEITAHPPGR